MKNFEVSRLYHQDGVTWVSDYPSELKLSNKDNEIFGCVVRNSKFRVWFKAITDMRMVADDKLNGEEGEIEEHLGQTGYLCIRIQNEKEKISIFEKFYYHKGYSVRVEHGWPWPGSLLYDPDLC